jgi:hypothetical protein
MSTFDSGVTTFEQVTRSISNAITAICFVAMVAVAVHIVTHPQGPMEAYRFYHATLTNFVDPEIETSVTRVGAHAFNYSYTVSNGAWGFQDIREIAIAGSSIDKRSHMGEWGVSRIGMGPGTAAVMWSSTPESGEDSGIGRGESEGGFIIQSYGLPVIVKAQAGHELEYDGRRGLSSATSTPVGRRVTRWALAPRDVSDNISPHALLGSLVPAVHRASELGWIKDQDLAAALRQALTASAVNIKLGEFAKATARLERLLRIVEANAGVQFSEEGYALVVYNVEHVLQSLSSGPIEFTQLVD